MVYPQKSGGRLLLLDGHLRLPVIHENGVMQRLHDTRLLRGARQIFVVLLNLGPQPQPFLSRLQRPVVGQFLSGCLAMEFYAAANGIRTA